ncbi:protein of unknown function [endosymbiont DhMRE of Dentiscutata heterogama]|uniref:hypothetical protein n=1 Tax=endosymbiont DhMRE of Dentiscutata heterogama TaxID=1609546 RepID=UPI000629D979|nr:hypothetical protein [endosymbiont DhMRE of Dentiscutata heterogama]CFW93051.1 protein of unknown function [endosymbiont DhMRE of Dentiscutata heterogama]
MNNNNELIHSTLVDAIEWLEKHIEKAGYFSDWEWRRQIHTISITRSDIGDMDASQVRHHFLVVLKALKVMLGFRENKFFDREELKTKFFQWIAAVKIDVDNCPADLGLLLYHFHEVLEGRGQNFSQQLSRKSDENISKMSKEEREKAWGETISAVKEQYEKIENGETEERQINPNGNAEEGKKIFEKVVTKISNYDLFPESEVIPDDNSPEAQVAIKELKELLEKKWTDKEAEEGENINQLALKLLKKIIQDLEAFESDKTANGGKNNYAWCKLGAGGKLAELIIEKSHLEGKLSPPSRSNSPTTPNNSSLVSKIVVISLIFLLILGIIIYVSKGKKKAKSKRWTSKETKKKT